MRAEGDEENQRIKATADREVAVFRADAGLKAQITMGEADGEATKIYADAFSKDKDFYAFWRRMEAYKQAFGSGGTMILSPDGDFFRYFNDPTGAGTAGGTRATSRPPARLLRRLWQPCHAAAGFFVTAWKRLKYTAT